MERKVRMLEEERLEWRKRRFRGKRKVKMLQVE